MADLFTFFNLLGLKPSEDFTTKSVPVFNGDS